MRVAVWALGGMASILAIGCWLFGDGGEPESPPIGADSAAPSDSVDHEPPRLATGSESTRAEIAAGIEAAPIPTSPGDSPRVSDPTNRTAWLVGRVLDAATHEPIEGARIIVPSDEYSEPRALAISAADGSYRTADFIRANSRGPVVVGAPNTLSQHFEDVPTAMGENVYDFRIDRAGPLYLRVDDAETRAPVEGVTIWCDAWPHLVEIARTDGYGRAVLLGAERLRRSAATLRARKPGYFGTLRFFDPSDVADRTSEVEFLVGRECRIEATALDVAGSPHGGRLALNLSDRVALSSDALEQGLPFEMPEGLDLEYRWHESRALDDSGRGVLEALPPLPFAQVWLHVDDRVRRYVAIEPFTACGQIRLVDFEEATVRDPGALAGRLTDDLGPAKASIELESSTTRRSLELEAKSDGTYRIDDIDPGIVTVFVKSNSTGEVRSLTLAIAPGATVYADFHFPRDPTRMVGRVESTTGAAVPGAEVVVTLLLGREEKTLGTTRTDGSGRFELRGLEDGVRYWIEATAAGFSNRGAEYFSGRVDVRIVLEPKLH